MLKSCVFAWMGNREFERGNTKKSPDGEDGQFKYSQDEYRFDVLMFNIKAERVSERGKWSSMSTEV